jgi:hypothetical protein
MLSATRPFATQNRLWAAVSCSSVTWVMTTTTSVSAGRSRDRPSRPVPDAGRETVQADSPRAATIEVNQAGKTMSASRVT